MNDADEKTAMLKELGNELKKQNLRLTMTCVGGFVMEQAGIRVTHDIDAFYEDTPQIRIIVKQIGRRHGIPDGEEAWLNNSVQNLNEKPPNDICDTFLTTENMTVLTAPLDYVMGMKFRSGRGSDITDAGLIIKHENITSMDELENTLDRYGFRGLDESALLEAMGLANGWDWLESYYRKNEQRINDSMDYAVPRRISEDKKARMPSTNEGSISHGFQF